MKRFIYSTLLILLLISVKSYAENDILDKAGLGVGINMLQIRYGFSPNYKIGGNIAYSERIFIIGARLMRQYKLQQTNFLYFGLESNLINFDYESIIGKGYMFYLPVGIEQYLTNSFAVSAELGPAYSWIKSNFIDVSQSSVDWMWNIYMTFYIGKSKI